MMRSVGTEGGYRYGEADIRAIRDAEGSRRQGVPARRDRPRRREAPKGDERGHEARGAGRGPARRDGGGRAARGDPRAHAPPVRGPGGAVRVRAEQAGARRRGGAREGDRILRDPRPGQGEADDGRARVEGPHAEEVRDHGRRRGDSRRGRGGRRSRGAEAEREVGMPTKRVCSFCGSDIEPGTGKMFVRRDGTVFFFGSSKCERNLLNLHRVPRTIRWTRIAIQAKSRAKGLAVEERAEVAVEEAEESPVEAFAVALPKGKGIPQAVHDLIDRTLGPGLSGGEIERRVRGFSTWARRREPAAGRAL